MPNLKGKKVLVTGAAGFIGANLVRKLLECKAKIYASISSRTNPWRIKDILSQIVVEEADILNEERLKCIVKKIRPQIVYHLAAVRGHPHEERERRRFFLVHALGTLNLLESLRVIDYERLIYFGSSLEYKPSNRALRENDNLRPDSFRGVTKAVASMLCDYFSKILNQPLVIIKPFSVYGYWEDPKRFIPTAITAFLRKGEIALTSKLCRHDFIFVEDLIEASLRATEEERAIGKVFNIGSGKQWTNEEVIAVLSDIFKYDIRIRKGGYPDGAWNTVHWVADNSSAKEILNWRPKYSLKQGLRKTIAWLRAHQDVYL
jgi:nucleoside-diphosphate-sugar epimerase